MAKNQNEKVLNYINKRINILKEQMQEYENNEALQPEKYKRKFAIDELELVIDMLN